MFCLYFNTISSHHVSRNNAIHLISFAAIIVLIISISFVSSKI